MGALILDGAALARRLTETLAAETARYCRSNPPPCLAVLTSGADPASQVYIRSKTRALEAAGMRSTVIMYGKTAGEQELITHIHALNADPSVDGILVQLPLPEGVDTRRTLDEVSPQKDIDGFTAYNLGKLLAGTPAFIPCTPQGILYLLQESSIPIAGAHAVIVGRSAIVGKPLAALLTAADATVTLCHSKTKDLTALTRQADIVIAAAGSPGLITGSMIKKGAAVIDAGINRIPDVSAAKGYRLTGDVVFEEVLTTAGFITPVPGGVGPLTVAMVLKNTLQAAMLHRNKENRLSSVPETGTSETVSI